MSNWNMYSYRTFHFPMDGFMIRMYAAGDTLKMKLSFDNPFVDSYNNIHCYVAEVREEILPEGMTMDIFWNLFEETYNEDNDCSFDFRETKTPLKMNMTIYENESGINLVSIDFVPKNILT